MHISSIYFPHSNQKKKNLSIVENEMEKTLEHI